MATMKDTFVRGEPFDGESGLKTGAQLEDLTARAYPSAASQLIDQATLETYSDGTILDDDGNAINRIRVKDGGISTAKIADKAVTAAKLADGTITNTQIASGGVLAANIGLLPFFVAKPASTQSIGVSSWTKVNLGTEVIDTHSYFASSIFTPQVAGYYIFSMQLLLNLGGWTNGLMAVGVAKNGSVESNQSYNFGTFSANQFGGVVMTTGPIEADGDTDYFEMYGWQDENTGCNIMTGSWFSGRFFCGLT